MKLFVPDTLQLCELRCSSISNGLLVCKLAATRHRHQLEMCSRQLQLSAGMSTTRRPTAAAAMANAAMARVYVEKHVPTEIAVCPVTSPAC